MLSPRHQALLRAAQAIADHHPEPELAQIFDRPLVILSAPRSGSNLLFESLRTAESLWSIGAESHFIFNAFPELHPATRHYESGALTEADATPERCHLMRACFLALAQDSAGRRYLDQPENERPASIRLLEKTPRNALNVPFMRKLFPGMQAIFLHRDPRETIASIMEAWQIGPRGGFVTFPDLPGWDRQHWCLLLPPGWRALNGKSLAEIAAFQWHAANRSILDALRMQDHSGWLPVSFDALREHSHDTLRRIAEFAGLPFEGKLRERADTPLPLSRTTMSTPAPGKWRRHEAEILAQAGLYGPLALELDSL